jgi:hypothetical protein
MPVSRLTDGLPITTEWLNSLADEINLLSVPAGTTQTTAGTTSVGSQISIGGQYFSNTTRPLQIMADRVTATAVAGSNIAELSPVFKTPFADNDVIVVATPSFVSNGTRKGKPFKAAASVGKITSKGFLLSVVLVNDEQDFNAGKEVIVDYIAIGKKK